jgi:hypothetical protein
MAERLERSQANIATRGTRRRHAAREAGGAVGQEIDDVVRLELDEDRPLGAA